MSSLKPAWVWDLLVVYYQVAEDEVEKANADCTPFCAPASPPPSPHVLALGDGGVLCVCCLSHLRLKQQMGESN